MPNPSVWQGISTLAAGLPHRGAAAAGIWAQHAPKRGKKEGISAPRDTGGSQPADNLSRIADKGIEHVQDVRDFIQALIGMGDAVAENPVQYGLDADQAAVVRFVSDLARSFDKHGIPVIISDDEEGSHAARTYPEMVQRMEGAAKKHGIAIAKGSSVSTVIHEITHAIPGQDFFKAAEGIFGAQETLITPMAASGDRILFFISNLYPDREPEIHGRGILRSGGGDTQALSRCTGNKGPNEFQCAPGDEVT
ncbi:MAG: hypothetical protein WC956_04885 [bacterium]